ncbi:MAG: FKBP-type peptidyl-prolyl cis-trans isomerase [Thaumarchaeota archaeon]|nr:FKBP-type peptidyl-prolyl cis-trans isomerase [Nitrososphaerota archaeon]MDE0525982.1 FKBP-type peptidyl-prolyl cis-trans isomerase [Nitrososphaerota archaeon]
MTFEKGSLILVEYTMRAKDSDAVIETTSEEDAKAGSIHDPEVLYAPRLVSVGEANYPVLKGFAEGLGEMSVGESRAIEVGPEKAWGVRDPKQVRTYPQRKLGKDADRYSAGDRVLIDDKPGIIRFMSSGRVQIDFNHVHAGKTLVYDATVKALLDKPDDIIRSILLARLSIKEPEFATDAGVLSITLAGDMLESMELPAAKRRIARDIFKFVPDLDSVRFVESFENKAKAAAKAQQQQQQPDPPAAADDAAGDGTAGDDDTADTATATPDSNAGPDDGRTA